MHKKQKLIAVLVGFALIGFWSTAKYLVENTYKLIAQTQKQKISASQLFLSMADYSAKAEITINSLDDALAKRDTLKKYIFGSDFPSRSATVEKLGTDDLPDELQMHGAHAAYKMTIMLMHGFGSQAFVFIPAQNYNGKAVIMHQGHGGPYSLTMDKKG